MVLRRKEGVLRKVLVGLLPIVNDTYTYQFFYHVPHFTMHQPPAASHRVYGLVGNGGVCSYDYARTQVWRVSTGPNNQQPMINKQ